MLEYDEIDYFVEQLTKIKNRLDIVNKLERIEEIRWAISSMKSKTGAQSYTQYCNNLRDQLKPENKREVNMFTQLKDAARKPKPLNLFERLKRSVK